MSLNTIELPDFVIAALYKDSLVVLAPDPAPVTPVLAPAPSQSVSVPPAPAPAIGSAVPGYSFLGNNQKKLTILVNSPGVKFLGDHELAFLTKMLEACKLNIGDVAIVNQATNPVTIAALKQQLEPSTILLFGLEPTAIRLPINFPQFKMQDFDHCTYLYAPSLEELVQPTEEGKLLKSKLWVCLRALFEI
jgi:hypothetical protein